MYSQNLRDLRRAPERAEGWWDIKPRCKNVRAPVLGVGGQEDSTATMMGAPEDRICWNGISGFPAGVRIDRPSRNGVQVR